MKDWVLVGTSGVATTTSFVATALPWLQAVSICIGIIAGSLAIYTHFTNIRPPPK